MPRYKLRTLLILLAVGPPVLAVCYLCWQPPRNFDSFEKLVAALATILVGVAFSVCLTVFWQRFWGGRSIQSPMTQRPSPDEN